MSDTSRPVLTLNRKPKAEPKKQRHPDTAGVPQKTADRCCPAPEKNKAAPAAKPPLPSKSKKPEPPAVKPESPGAADTAENG